MDIEPVRILASPVYQCLYCGVPLSATVTGPYDREAREGLKVIRLWHAPHVGCHLSEAMLVVEIPVMFAHRVDTEQ